ncbi:MAG: AAA family ATPase, partial [Nanoarchaeota archaeon]
AKIAKIKPRAAIRRLHSNFGSLERKLNDCIVGQREAVTNLVQVLKRASIGLREKHKPRANILHAGRTGVSKTELAKALAGLLPGYRLYMVNGSELGSPHEYANLIGSPRGYVGFDQGGTLTSNVLAHSKTIVVWDEFEEAHQKAQSLLLQVFDEGTLTDSKHGSVSFRDTINIVTTNIGTKEVERYCARVGFTSGWRNDCGFRDLYEKALNDAFHDKLINRLDMVSIFNDLNASDCQEIARLGLRKIQGVLLENRGLQFNWTQAVPREIVKYAEFEKFGGRGIKRAVGKIVEDPLADMLEREKDIKKVKVYCEGEKICLKRE